MNQEQAKRIKQQVVEIVLCHPFFSTLLLKMKIEENINVPTFCTDGIHIYYNPDFCASLTDPQIRGILAHEVLHPALGHLWRIGSRDMGLSNQAADHAINLHLEEYNDEFEAAGKPRPFPLPAGVCCDPRFKDMSFEEIYAILESEKDENGGEGEGAPGPGDFMEPAVGPGKDGEGNSESDWKIATAQAAQAAKAMGQQSASVNRFLGEATQPRVRWTDVLQRFVSASATDDFSETHYDRRFTGEGFYLPDLYSEAVGEIAVVVDTSGSIDDGILNQFKAELIDMMGTVRPSKLLVMYADAAVCHEEEFSCGEEIVMNPKGGGGTDFRPALEAISKRAEQPQCAVYLTDGHGTFPSEAPGYPVLWCVLPGGQDQIPFGEVVKMV